MKFIYIGSGRDTTAFDITFPVNVPTEVTDEHAIKKLSNNPQFERAKDDNRTVSGESVEQVGNTPSRKPATGGRPRKCN
jgi:hypothetical protein